MGPVTLKAVQEIVTAAASNHTDMIMASVRMWQRLSFALARSMARQLLISAAGEDLP